MIIKSFSTEFIYCHKSFVSIFTQLFMCRINTTVKPNIWKYRPWKVSVHNLLFQTFNVKTLLYSFNDKSVDRISNNIRTLRRKNLFTQSVKPEMQIIIRRQQRSSVTLFISTEDEKSGEKSRLSSRCAFKCSLMSPKCFKSRLLVLVASCAKKKRTN